MILERLLFLKLEPYYLTFSYYRTVYSFYQRYNMIRLNNYLLQTLKLALFLKIEQILQVYFWALV